MAAVHNRNEFTIAFEFLFSSWRVSALLVYSNAFEITQYKIIQFAKARIYIDSTNQGNRNGDRHGGVVAQSAKLPACVVQYRGTSSTASPFRHVRRRGDWYVRTCAQIRRLQFAFVTARARAFPMDLARDPSNRSDLPLNGHARIIARSLIALWHFSVSRRLETRPARVGTSRVAETDTHLSIIRLEGNWDDFGNALIDGHSSRNVHARAKAEIFFN